MKKIILLLSLSLVNPAWSATEKLLFLQTTGVGEITKLHGNNYILTLAKLPKYVGYFAENPKKLAGVVSLPSFISLWGNKNQKNSFYKNPPHASIVLVSREDERQTISAVICNPSLIDNTLSYQIMTKDNIFLRPGKLKHISVFFADINWNPEN